MKNLKNFFKHVNLQNINFKKYYYFHFNFILNDLNLSHFLSIPQCMNE
ncbi:hypothetical protein EXIGUO9Y_100046 [Exiguobacterium oxidotolerans]|uniref:Uncharacterized protein n=1 Tax=Exiguobacterium oxidotolerans TaxID=223958 RepID=A0A653I2I5_9BACL|nr:hypothetical protein EXIGUO9Y_100046 [Exiguobacterium oxidotolerans]